jgi:ABC-type uncharacterized transport system permease subunit
MIITSLQERILHNIYLLELFSRIGMSLFFGLSLFSFACVMQIQDRQKTLAKKILKIAKIFFILGSTSIIMFAILEFILPSISLASEIYTIGTIILAVSLLGFNTEKRDYPALAFTISSIIFLLMTLISFLEPKVLIQTEKNNFLINFHITTSITGLLLFISSFCASFLFITNHNKIKKKEIEFSQNSTSLSKLEKIIIKSSIAGLAFITLALISGILIISIGTQNSYQTGFIKVFWAFFVWAWFAISILGRNLWGWKGRKGAWLILTGSVILLFGLIGNFFYYS